MIDPKVYKLLSETEKLAMGLQLGLSKSSWEAGEIMGKSHYKYLEIRYRAEKFLRMFTEHFKLYDSMAPDCVTGTRYIIVYLGLCMEQRLKPSEALEQIRKTQTKLNRTTINQKISEHIKTWSNSTNPHDQVFMNLVKEFDRWNNFRILPPDVREPSAYKRRIKNFYKKHIKILTTIPKVSLDKLLKTYKTQKSPCLYWPYVYGSIYKIEKVKQIKSSLDTFNNLSMYLFKNKQDALDYIIPIMDYTTKTDRDCKDGLDFWPQYRESIKLAYNYQEVQNIIPQRKYLDLALAQLKFI